MNQNQTQSKPSHSKQRSGKGLSVQRFLRHWRRVAWPAVILGGISLFALGVRWWMHAIGDKVTGWWNKIDDPTERGCAYIATAITAHALVMAFKSMSHDHDRIKVEGFETPNGVTNSQNGN